MTSLKALIIDDPWIGLILSGKKTWEIADPRYPHSRPDRTDTERLQPVVGVAELVGTLPNLSVSRLKANVERHQVPAANIDDEFKWNTAWIFERARALFDPVPYRHPAGAVIWVNLDPDTTMIVEERMRKCLT